MAGFHPENVRDNMMLDVVSIKLTKTALDFFKHREPNNFFDKLGEWMYLKFSQLDEKAAVEYGKIRT